MASPHAFSDYRNPTLGRWAQALAAALLLVVFAPVIVVAMAAIRLDSGGPVFFRATRVGQWGKSFTMLKLRTMHVGPSLQNEITARNDTRITSVGRMLRKWKIDELPQLINILVGDMAFVGPRPESPAIVREHYTDDMKQVLNVKPGLTSPGTLFNEKKSAELTDEATADARYVTHILPERVRLDLDYLKRQTMWTDARLILQTLALLASKMRG